MFVSLQRIYSALIFYHLELYLYLQLSDPNDRNDTIYHYFSDSRATKDGRGDEGHVSIGFNQRDALTQPNLPARPTIWKAFVFKPQRFSEIIGFDDADGWQLAVHRSWYKTQTEYIGRLADESCTEREEP